MKYSKITTHFDTLFIDFAYLFMTNSGNMNSYQEEVELAVVN